MGNASNNTQRINELILIKINTLARLCRNSARYFSPLNVDKRTATLAFGIGRVQAREKKRGERNGRRRQAGEPAGRPERGTMPFCKKTARKRLQTTERIQFFFFRSW
jgi:hypothetical protein